MIMPKKDIFFLKKNKHNFSFSTSYIYIHPLIEVYCWWSSAMQHLLTDKCRLDTFLISEEVNHSAHEHDLEQIVFQGLISALMFPTLGPKELLCLSQLLTMQPC